MALGFQRIPMSISSLAEEPAGYTPAAVEWKTIRAAFIRERGRRTQEEIATAAGLPQSAISKLESNDNLGPAVGTFVKAVGGLGLTPSGFFAHIESPRAPSALASDARSVHSSAGYGDPLSPTADVVDLRSVIIAVGETLGETVAESLDRAVDRLAAAREQTPAPRARASVRGTSRRKAR